MTDEMHAAVTEAWRDALLLAANIATRRIELGRSDDIPDVLRRLASPDAEACETLKAMGRECTE